MSECMNQAKIKTRRNLEKFKNSTKEVYLMDLHWTPDLMICNIHLLVTLWIHIDHLPESIMHLPLKHVSVKTKVAVVIHRLSSITTMQSEDYNKNKLNNFKRTLKKFFLIRERIICSYLNSMFPKHSQTPVWQPGKHLFKI